MLTRIMLVYPLIMGLGTIATAVLNGKRRFLLSALSLALYDIGLIGGLLISLAIPGVSIYGPTFGLLASAICQVAVLIPGLRKQGAHNRGPARLCSWITGTDSGGTARPLLLRLERCADAPAHQYRCTSHTHWSDHPPPPDVDRQVRDSGDSFSCELDKHRPGGTALSPPAHTVANKGENGQRYATPATAVGKREETKDLDRASYS